MTELVWSGALLARVTWLEGMMRQFSGGNRHLGTMHLVLLTLIVAILVAVMARFSSQVGKPRYNNPRALFRALCRAHRLDLGSRRLLDRLARQQRLADPARLFLEPERFELNNLGPTLKSQQARFVTLRDRLFTEPSAASRDASSDRRRTSASQAPRRG
jgi:hypothetical protein